MQNVRNTTSKTHFLQLYIIEYCMVLVPYVMCRCMIFLLLVRGVGVYIIVFISIVTCYCSS